MRAMGRCVRGLLPLLPLLPLLLLLTLPAVVQAQFTYTTNNGTLTITGYTGTGGDVTIPDTTNGLLVTSIGDSAFSYCTSLASITIPKGVTSIGLQAFVYCTNLTAAYFKGNAPSLPVDGQDLFALDPTTVYYLPGTTGWSNFSATTGRPTVLWNPQAQNLGVQTNQLGFAITGSSNLVVVVEGCTNPANPLWAPVGTNTLNTFIGTNGMSYFSDAQWTNYPARLYRIRSP
jgi:hypothetical protein